jgi:hypothetical protein
MQWFYFIVIAFIAFTLHEIKLCPVFWGDTYPVYINVMSFKHCQNFVNIYIATRVIINLSCIAFRLYISKNILMIKLRERRIYFTDIIYKINSNIDDDIDLLYRPVWTGSRCADILNSASCNRLTIFEIEFFLCWCNVLRWIWCLWCYSAVWILYTQSNITSIIFEIVD